MNSLERIHRHGLSIIAEGGVLKGAFALGVIEVLYNRGLMQVDVATGSSASIPTLAYYTAGQFKKGFWIWPDELPDARFISIQNIMRGKPFVNIDYLIDTVFKKNVPLDIRRVNDSPIRLIIPVTNARTGTAEYFDNTHFDFFEILRASIAVPIVYGRGIRVGSETYYDGFIADPIPIDHPLIKDTFKIIILTKKDDERDNHDSLFARLFQKTMTPALLRAWKMNKNLERERMREVMNFDCDSALVFKPLKKIPKFDNRRDTILRSIEHGRMLASASNELDRLLTALKKGKKFRKYFTSF